MDSTVIASRVAAAHAVLLDAGFPRARVVIDFTAWPYVSVSPARPRALVDLDISTGRLLFESFDTIEMALDAIDAAIRDLPHVWTKDDVAATLGIIDNRAERQSEDAA